MPASDATPILSLLTDFGTRDHYVGVMKAVIAGICPRARLIDISHEVEPFQIAQGGYLLSQAWKWFPPGTVHLAVVDPGVGTARRAIVAAAHGQFFVLPDNGLLSRIGLHPPLVREIRNQALMLQPVSQTFHGRDIFAPAAAHLACGFLFEQTGPLIDDWMKLPPAVPSVLHIDRFGNIVTSLRAVDCQGFSLRVRRATVSLRVPNYSSVDKDRLFIIEGSGGYLEISQREGSAAARIGCQVGDPVTPS